MEHGILGFNTNCWVVHFLVALSPESPEPKDPVFTGQLLAQRLALRTLATRLLPWDVACAGAAHGSHTLQNMPCKPRTLCASLSLSLSLSLCRLLCARPCESLSVHVALRKLLRACRSAQVTLCKLLCASFSAQVALCVLLCASCCVQLRAVARASCSAQVALCKLLCVSFSVLLCCFCAEKLRCSSSSCGGDFPRYFRSEASRFHFQSLPADKGGIQGGVRQSRECARAQATRQLPKNYPRKSESFSGQALRKLSEQVI